MKHLLHALEVVKSASDALAVHSGRAHDECAVCADIGVQLIAAEEAIERALADASVTATSPAPSPFSGRYSGLH